MSRQGLSFALALAGLAVLAVSPSARGCVCGLIEPDTAYRSAVLVFTGTVEKVTELTREVVEDGKTFLSSEGRITRLKVEKYFKGAGDSEIELRSSNTSCDISFKVGERYVVYATQNVETGALGAFTCSRTRPVDDYARPDISYLPRAARGASPTMLYGFAFRNTEESAKRGLSDPLANLAITIEGEGKRLELKTDSRGYFETYDLQPGNYTVRTEVTGKLRGAEARTVELPADAVASVVFRTTTMGSLSGRVLDREGGPVRDIQVELLPPGGNPLPGRIITYVSTGEDGRFVFHELVAGRYVLGINSTGRRSLYSAPFLPSYFPKAASNAEAKVITVADGIETDVGDFVVQERYPTVEVAGVVITPDGKPVEGASVSMNKSGGDWDATRSVHTDSAGRFLHHVFEGVTYTIHAMADAPTGGILESGRIEITAARGARPLRIVVRSPE
jgi:hypothetical protein